MLADITANVGVSVSAPIANVVINENNESFLRQHLIDPELCLACGSCESACQAGAIKPNSKAEHYIIDATKCSNGHECLVVCGSEAIRSWRMVPAGQVYSLQQQDTWDHLPAELEIDGKPLHASLDQEEVPAGHPAPASASEPHTFLYTQQKPVIARIRSNTRVTAAGSETDIHHVVLDFAGTDFKWLEGQNIGVLPPGTSGDGHAHHMRAYSIASDRNGETAGSQEMALTIKRVVDEWEGQPYYGVASNFMCDLKAGDSVRCVGPIGARFLMPQDPAARIMMICTGTGIAPMRSFIQRQQRDNAQPQFPLQLFYGGRTSEDMAYCDELRALPGTLLNMYLALSRSPSQPRQYVQDLLREQAALVADFLRDKNSTIFICGLISMEHGVMDALATVAAQNGLDWTQLRHDLLHEGRLQIETY
jgi:benzoyl-CoA 2,3-dioxygenase component A